MPWQPAEVLLFVDGDDPPPGDLADLTANSEKPLAAEPLARVETTPTAPPRRELFDRGLSQSDAEDLVQYAASVWFELHYDPDRVRNYARRLIRARVKELTTAAKAGRA